MSDMSSVKANMKSHQQTKEFFVNEAYGGLAKLKIDDREIIDSMLSDPWDMADISLLVEHRSIHVNKTILAMWSPYFKHLFNTEYKDGVPDEIPLPGKKYNHVLQLMDLIHPTSGKSMADVNVPVVALLANEFDMEKIVKNCEEYMLRQTPSVTVWAMAEQCQMRALEERCRRASPRWSIRDMKKDMWFDRLDPKTRYGLLFERVIHYEEVIQFMVETIFAKRPAQKIKGDQKCSARVTKKDEHARGSRNSCVCGCCSYEHCTELKAYVAEKLNVYTDVMK